MEVILINTDAFYALVAEAVKQIKAKEKIAQDTWISAEEAMAKLRITSTTTLYQMRVKGLIKYSNPLKKLILYDSRSIDAYLEKHAKNTY